MKAMEMNVSSTLIVDSPLLGIKESLPDGIKKRIEIRFLSENDWIERHASGTLRKNKRLGFTYRSQYLHERVAYEFGWTFNLVPTSRVLWGAPFTEGDCKPITEAGWFAERYINLCIFSEDYFEVKYINITNPDDTITEGVGLIVRQTSAPWIGTNNSLYCIIAEFDNKTKKWLDARNPF